MNSHARITRPYMADLYHEVPAPQPEWIGPCELELSYRDVLCVAAFTAVIVAAITCPAWCGWLKEIAK